MHHRRIFIVLFLSLFVAMLGAGVIAPTMPLYAKTMGASGIWLGLIYSAFSMSRSIFMPMAGKISDRYGRKQFITIGLTIYTLASLGYGWAGSISQLVWIRFMHGVGSAMVLPIAAAAIGDISPKGKEGSMMGTFNVALFLGFGAGPLLGGIILDTMGMATVFYVMGGLSATALAAVFFLIPEKKKSGSEKTKKISRFLEIWKDSRFKGLLLFRFSNAVIRGSMIVFLPIFASHLNISPSEIGMLVSLNILLAALLQHVFGRVADRFNRYVLIIAGSLLTALPVFLTPFADQIIHLIILSVFMGLGAGFAFPAAAAVATDLGRDHGMGNIMGFFNQAMSFGMILGPIFSGWIMDLLGLSVVFIFGGCVGTVGAIICILWFFRKQEGKAIHAHI